MLHIILQTQQALLRLEVARQLSLIPDLLLPMGWQPVMIDASQSFYKASCLAGWLHCFSDLCSMLLHAVRSNKLRTLDATPHLCLLSYCAYRLCTCPAVLVVSQIIVALTEDSLRRSSFKSRSILHRVPLLAQ